MTKYALKNVKYAFLHIKKITKNLFIYKSNWYLILYRRELYKGESHYGSNDNLKQETYTDIRLFTWYTNPYFPLGSCCEQR